MDTSVGPYDKVSFNSEAAVSILLDGSISISTGYEGFSGPVYVLGSDGVILMDGVPYAPAATTPEPVAPPAFIAPTFNSGWSNNGNVPGMALPEAGYRKHADGTVELNGVVNKSGSGSNNIFLLPPGYRPKDQKSFAVNAYDTQNGGDTLAFVKVQPSGQVFLSRGASTTVFLTGIRFPLT